MSTEKTNRYTVIGPNTRVSDSAFTATRHLLGEIKQFRSQIWTVFTQNFRNSYYGTGFGLLWNFILPLVPITVYLFLSVIKVFPNFDGVSRSVYVTFGVTIWFVFAGFVLKPMNIVKNRNEEAMKTSMPLIANVTSSFADLAFDTVIRIVFVLVVAIMTLAFPKWTSPALFLIFIAASFLFLGAGLLLGIMNVIYKDVGRLTEIVLRYGIFLSGVIFPMGSSDRFHFFNQFNPFAIFVEASRQVVFKGYLEDYMILPLAVWSLLGIVVFFIGCRMFYVMEYRIRGIR